MAVCLFMLLLQYVEVFQVFFRSIENKTYDMRIEWSSAQPAEPDIAIIGIDDKSLEVLGRWPWNREVHTQFVDSLAQYEPRVVVFDVLFSEPAEDLKQDERLAASFKKIPQVVLSEYAQFSSETENGKLQVQNMIRPYGPFREFLTGHINVIPDDDGVIRKGLLSFEWQGDKVRSVDQVAVEAYTGFEFDENVIGRDSLNRWYIPYVDAGSYPIYSYVDVINGKVPKDALEDRLLLVGSTTVGIHDRYPTPLGSVMNGVAIHAHAIDALYKERFLIPVGFDWLWIVLMVVLGMLFARLFTLRIGVILVLVSVFAYAFASLVIIQYQGLILLTFPPILALLVSYASQIGFSYFTERQERQQVIRLFGRFVAPQVVDEILRLGEAGIKLGGTRKYISVLFLDVRGFTPLSEKMQPEEIVDVLNSFFHDITKSIFEHGGTLDKFIGDAVMAIFNAPLELENHEVQAVRTAIQIQQRAQVIQRRLEEKYGRTVAFGIGVNCGDAVVGNIGAMERLDYTAIGDTVNLAARLESNSKPNQIIISQRVYEQVIAAKANDIRMTYMGAINVKGKSEPVEIYEVHHKEEDQDPVAVVNSEECSRG